MVKSCSSVHMWVHVLQRKNTKQKYSDGKGNLYCTPAELLHCALLVSHVA